MKHLLMPMILVAGLGAAAQNILTVIMAILMTRTLVVTNPSGVTLEPIRRYLIATLLFLASILCSGLVQNNAASTKVIEWVFGYSNLLILPAAGYMVFSRLNSSEWHRILRVVTYFSAFIAIICLVQFLWGWQREGVQIVTGEARARGLYSHPLTLAYVASLLYPLALHLALTRRTGHAIGFFVAVLVMIISSNSRIVIAVQGCFSLFYLFPFVPRRFRIITAAATLVVAGLVLTVPNPIQQKFKMTIQGQADHLAGSYPDDRLLFWHVHLLMIADRPLIGTGPHANKSIREEKYAQLGFADFTKKYNAHNAYLQILADGGVIAFAFFLFWLMTVYQLIRPLGLVAVSTLCCFLLTALTQNSLQDNEVRYLLALLIGITTPLAELRARPETALDS
jgi:O-antigen ligase